MHGPNKYVYLWSLVMGWYVLQDVHIFWLVVSQNCLCPPYLGWLSSYITWIHLVYKHGYGKLTMYRLGLFPMTDVKAMGCSYPCLFIMTFLLGSQPFLHTGKWCEAKEAWASYLCLGYRVYQGGFRGVSSDFVQFRLLLKQQNYTRKRMNHFRIFQPCLGPTVT